MNHPSTKIGFIGLGILGTPMAINQVNAGYELFVTSSREVPDALTDVGGIACATAQEVAQRAEIIILTLPDTPDVEKVLFGPQGLGTGLSPGKS